MVAGRTNKRLRPENRFVINTINSAMVLGIEYHSKKSASYLQEDSENIASGIKNKQSIFEAAGLKSRRDSTGHAYSISKALQA